MPDLSFLPQWLIALILAAGIGWIWTSCVLTVSVFEHQLALLYRNGRLRLALPPGKHRFWRPGAEVVLADARSQTTIIAGQEVLTSDALAVKVSLALTWRLVDLAKARAASVDYTADLYLAGQLALRAAAGSRDLDALLADPGAVAAEVAASLAPRAEALGLAVEAVALRDVMLPAPLKRAYAAEVEARKEAAGALEKARGEQAVLRKLANLAKMVEESPGLMDLRALQAFADSPHVHVALGLGGARVPPTDRAAQ